MSVSSLHACFSRNCVNLKVLKEMKKKAKRNEKRINKFHEKRPW